MTRIATILPPGLVRYKQTSEFTPQSVPDALLAAHSVKAGVWGLLRVLRGRVRYCFDGEPPASLIVGESGTALIEPEVRHHVQLLGEDSVFLVEFYRAEVAA
jgi:hemoglobin